MCSIFFLFVTFYWSQFIVYCFIFLSLLSSSFMIDHWIHCFNWCLFVCLYRWNIFLWYISIVGKYLEWKNHIDPQYIVSYPYLSSHLMFQFMFVSLYRWNIFLWYIFIASKYLKWKNHIIWFYYILSSQYLNISISYFNVMYLFDLNSLYIVSYPYLFSRPLLFT